MIEIKTYRLRKCSDISMEYSYFKVLDESEETIFDVSKSDEGEFRILFYEGASSKCMTIAMLNAIIEDAKDKIERD